MRSLRRDTGTYLGAIMARGRRLMKSRPLRPRLLPVIVAFPLFMAFSCTDPFPEKTDYDEGQGLFICNEGNMTFGNASLSFYDPATETVKNQVFYNTNEFPLGDVLQSMTIIDTLGYLVINNSGKIFVMDTRTMLHRATITGFTSPRYMLPIDTHTAYVSDLYSPSITVIDPLSFAITGSIPVGAGTEQMILSGSDVFVCSWSFNNKIFRINSLTHTVTDSLEVNMQPNSMVQDREGMVWVLSDGGYPGMVGGEHAALTCIDPVSFTVIRELTFPDISSSPTELKIDPSGDTLYFINNTTESPGRSNGIYQFPVHSAALPEKPLIEAGNRLFYGLAADPETGILYASDAIDHIQKGWVYRYLPQGALIDSFKVDIIPGEFCFKPK